MSVFEANIRMLGGLLSAHLLVEDDPTLMPNYKGEFLVPLFSSLFSSSLLLSNHRDLCIIVWWQKDLAKELGGELLYAFKTADGIPYKRVRKLSMLFRTQTTDIHSIPAFISYEIDTTRCA